MADVKEVRVPAPRAEEVSVDKSLSQDDQYKIKLISEQLTEIGRVVGLTANGTASKSDVDTAYNKLHSSWRMMMSLRGKAFLDAFDVFVVKATEFRTGIFHPIYVNRNLENGFTDPNEREVFVIFMNMIVRYASTIDKSKFTELNSVQRLTRRISDPELPQLIAHAFGEI